MLSETSADEVAARFGLGDAARLEGPVARGELGQVWRLTTATGTYAVKDPFFDVDAASCERDAAYQDRVRAGGVPMPAVVRSVEGRVLETVDGTRVRIYEWVDVLPKDPMLDPVVVGRTLAAIHRVVVPVSEPVEDWYAAPVGAEGWSDMVARLRRADAPFADDLDACRPTIDASERLIRPVRAAQRCHLDLWSDNVLPTPSGDVVVLDWENSGPGVPSQELLLVLAEFGAGWGVDQPDRVRALVAAYEETGGPGRITGTEDATMLVAQLGHILQVGCERWLSSASDDERSHNEAWVREYLDQPPTVALVEFLLDTAASS